MTLMPCGHQVCIDHLVKIDEDSFRKEAIQILKEISLNNNNYYRKDYYAEQARRSLLLLNNCEYEIEEFTRIYEDGSSFEYVTFQCPICSPNYWISDKNLLEYVLTSRGLSREDIESEFRKKFAKIEDFNKKRNII
jgi:hypothetical protein